MSKEKLIDFISGKEIIKRPEEEDAVQPFSKILVEDYGYKKEQIKTRPQFRVSLTPSNKKKSFPVDIAVFSDTNKTDENVYIIVECKNSKQRDTEKSIEQLKDYLRFSRAKIGIWYNGKIRHIFLKHEKNGEIIFEKIDTIPLAGQRIDDIGQFKRKDLKHPHNLKAIFKNIRHYLAGNAEGITRDEEFAKQIINMIILKLYDEKYTTKEDMVKFRAGIDESANEVTDRIKKRFKEAKGHYGDVLDDDDEINLDNESVKYIVSQLQSFSFIDAERDIMGDAFEIFTQKSLKGDSGQFFTPKNVVKTAVKIINPKINNRIIDPACGSGGFLTECLKHIHEQIDKQAQKYEWTDKVKEDERRNCANNKIFGIDKDKFLTKLSKAYMIIIGDGRGGIFCDNSLLNPSKWKNKTQSKISLESFDIVLTNPPFGKKIKIDDEKILKQYDLGYKWKEENGIWIKGKLSDKRPPQILFIERCLDLLKEGGRLGIVLPDGILSNPTDRYIIQFLLKKTEILGLIDMPQKTFSPHTNTKTHLLFLKKTKKPKKNYEFFMSFAKSCGHDKRGSMIESDEISDIPDYLENIGEKTKYNHLGFIKNIKTLKNNVLLPKYYNPDIDNTLKEYKESGRFDIKSFGSLEKEKIIKISRGNEIGSENYGTGNIPFIRTSEIANWEIIADPTHCIDEETYNKYKDRQDLKDEDILVVNDGTYLIGRAAMITDFDEKIVIQSHFKKIRVLDKDRLSPYLLLGLIGTDIVQRQIHAFSFTQSNLSTLGDRLKEIMIPIPINKKEKEEITNKIKEIIKNKRKGKEDAQKFKIFDKNEQLMGIINKSNLGNL